MSGADTIGCAGAVDADGAPAVCGIDGVADEAVEAADGAATAEEEGASAAAPGRGAKGDANPASSMSIPMGTDGGKEGGGGRVAPCMAALSPANDPSAFHSDSPAGALALSAAATVA